MLIKSFKLFESYLKSKSFIDIKLEEFSDLVKNITDEKFIFEYKNDNDHLIVINYIIGEDSFRWEVHIDDNKMIKIENGRIVFEETIGDIEEALSIIEGELQSLTGILESNKSKNIAVNKKLWKECKDWAKSKFDVYPSAYALGAAAKRYKSKGGKWRKGKPGETNEPISNISEMSEIDMDIVSDILKFDYGFGDIISTLNIEEFENSSFYQNPIDESDYAKQLKNFLYSDSIDEKKKQPYSDTKGGLDKWFKEKWVDISKKNPDGSHPPCGRKDASKGGYPKCRKVRVAAKMTDKEKLNSTKRKRRAEKSGKGGSGRTPNYSK